MNTYKGKHWKDKVVKKEQVSAKISNTLKIKYQLGIIKHSKGMLGKHHTGDKTRFAHYGKHLVSKKCLVCNNIISTYPCYIDKRKYCSKKCSNNEKHNPFKSNNPSKKLKNRIASSERAKKLFGGNSGKNNPNYRGGISFEIYPQEFNKELKRQIKIRDGYKCQMCNHIEKELDVHHIDYNKRNSNPNNLITLCKSCHSKTSGGNRQYYEWQLKIFMNLFYGADHKISYNIGGHI